MSCSMWAAMVTLGFLSLLKEKMARLEDSSSVVLNVSAAVPAPQQLKHIRTLWIHIYITFSLSMPFLCYHNHIMANELRHFILYCIKTVFFILVGTVGSVDATLLQGLWFWTWSSGYCLCGVSYWFFHMSHRTSSGPLVSSYFVKTCQ